MRSIARISHWLKMTSGLRAAARSPAACPVLSGAQSASPVTVEQGVYEFRLYTAPIQEGDKEIVATFTVEIPREAKRCGA